MTSIALETQIAAPPERCFLLSLSIDLHVESTARTREQAIDGVTHGLIGPGERVTWRGRHFGFNLTHESQITLYHPPQHFRDEMVHGAFRSFVHDHWFAPTNTGGTLMRDELRFEAPFGPLGHIAERLLLQHYLKNLLYTRNETIKRIAEGPEDIWAPYLAPRPPISAAPSSTTPRTKT
jgi:ligand-binding SRPBCC domain-containing protein